MALAVPAVAEVTDQDLDEARQEVNRLVGESQDLTESVFAAWAHQAELETEIDGLRSSIDLAQVRLGETKERLEEVAVQLYMGSTSGLSLTVAFRAKGDGYEAGLQYLRDVRGVDDSLIDQLETLRRELDHQTARLEEASEEQAGVTAELESMAADLQGQLVTAQAFYDDQVARKAAEDEQRRQDEERRRLEEAARQEAARQATTTSITTRAAPPPPATTTTTTSGQDGTTTTTSPSSAPPPGSGTCPVAGAVTFTNNFGAPRSGGRAHEGIDMMAARGTPLVAIYSGTIRWISTGVLGGKQIWVRTADGDEWFYAHLDGYGNVSIGQHVDIGYVIGYVGSTGNAPEWLPHLHIEYHPGGGSAVNPYSILRSLCG